MRRSAHDFFRCCILKLVENNHKQSKQCWMVLFLKQLDLFTGEQFTHVELSAQICEKIQRCAVALGLSYIETRLLRTLKGNEKRYVLTKVLSIQNAIFLTGRIGSTCSRERSATEDASPSWMLFITRFSYGEIAFQGIVNLKTCREIEIEIEGWMTCSWSEKKEPKKVQKSAPGGKFGTCYPILCHVLYVLSEKKKMYMFSDWRCPWSTVKTL